MFAHDLCHSQIEYLSLRLVDPTLSPSCKLYEQEAGLEALRAGSGAGGLNIQSGYGINHVQT